MKMAVVVQPSRLHRRRPEAGTTIFMLNGAAAGGGAGAPRTLN
jgi:hypothetical protein